MTEEFPEGNRAHLEIIRRLESLATSQQNLGQELSKRLGDVEDVIRHVHKDFNKILIGESVSTASAETAQDFGKDVNKSLAEDGTSTTHSETVPEEGQKPLLFDETAEIAADTLTPEGCNESLLDGVVLQEREADDDELCTKRFKAMKSRTSPPSPPSSASLANHVATTPYASHLDLKPETAALPYAGFRGGKSTSFDIEIAEELGILSKSNTSSSFCSSQDLWEMSQQASLSIHHQLSNSGQVSDLAGKLSKAVGLGSKSMSKDADRLRRVSSNLSRVSETIKKSVVSFSQSTTPGVSFNQEAGAANPSGIGCDEGEPGGCNARTSVASAFDEDSDYGEESTDMRQTSVPHEAQNGMAPMKYHLLPGWSQLRELSLENEEEEGNSDTSGESTHLADAASLGSRKRSLLRRQSCRSFGGDLFPDKLPWFKKLSINRFLAFIIISPFSTKRTLWDLLSMLLIGYDVIFVPMQAFKLPTNIFTAVAGWTATIFWTCDMPLSFITGYDDPVANRIEKAPSKVFLRYITTWFLFDIVCLVPDWISIAYGADSVDQLHGVGRTVKILKGLRALRLLRLVKVRKAIMKFEKRFNNDYMTCYLNLVKLMLAIGVLMHYIGCGFKGVSDLEEDDGWAGSPEYKDTGMGHKYLSSLHWALSQFQGSSQVSPITTIERAYAVTVLYLSVVVAAAFISSITNSMTRIQQIYSAKNTRKWILLRYLDDNNISGVLSLRVKTFVEKVIQEERTRAGEVELLRLLPEDLRAALELESKTPVFNLHPLLLCLTQADVELAKHLSCALLSLRFSNNDHVFEKDEPATRMYIVTSGKLAYTESGARGGKISSKVSTTMRATRSFLMQTAAKRKGGSVGETRDSVYDDGLDVRRGAVLAEMSLWTRWDHQGTCKALTLADVCQLQTSKFEEAMAKHGDQCIRVVRYGAKYINWMNSFSQIRLLNDLSSPMQHERLEALPGGTTGSLKAGSVNNRGSLIAKGSANPRRSL